ncbi:hypothetical protein ELI13_36875 [Rhizobium ruizarguesonis]|uniref:Uncharacterized protein n=1 Tax=Rhizobium ruizarguesonis TaxID=2081791 RepID=A0AB38HSQ8_9HYPH|nr:hypothetical protein [Rhizobium leguminosarum bv. viciae]TAT97598.1 hypothetical protein ELI49_30455 [Rhizobium ruizarguesonis]NKL15883.1 hypothetical protein [Rhizobium leguminosarum bv. viciae]NKL31951.1 hypothetical protein [Rhizobium leguminosarum bv. viciae]NKL44972.1 hypothetical protein [Rhizobium leguminosarum bv. viciae]
MTGDRLRLDRLTATAICRFLTPDVTSSSPANKSASCRPPFHFGLIRCGPIVAGLCDSHRGRDGRGPIHTKGT